MTRRATIRLIAGALGVVAVVAGWLVLGPRNSAVARPTRSLSATRWSRGSSAATWHSFAHATPIAQATSSCTTAPHWGRRSCTASFASRTGHFVVKGDNNDFVDEERPTEAQIAGTLWVPVPVIGRVAGWLGSPLHSALFIGLVTLFALGGIGARGPGRPPIEPRHLVAGVAVAIAAFGVLAFVSFTRSATATQAVDEVFVHEGRFNYRGEVRRDAVYPNGRVTTGEPIFLKLVSKLRVSFDYRLRSERGPAGGTIALDARLSDGRGWERVFKLKPAREFRGRGATVAGTLDLRRIQALTETMRRLTGSAQTVFSLTLLPRVSISGRADDSPIDSTFAPELAFELADLRLQPSLDATGAGLGPFAPHEAVGGSRAVARALGLGPVTPSVRTARAFSLLGLACALLLGALLLRTRQARPREEHERIEARYGHLLLPIYSRPPERRRINELGDIDSLVRLATQHGRVVLHLVEDGEHSYVVEDGGSVYRYRSESRAARLRRLQRVPFEMVEH